MESLRRTRVLGGALVVLVSLLSPASAWVSSSLSQQCTTRRSCAATASTTKSKLSAISTPSNENAAAGGRVLEGGKVIDFSSVKADSKAEQALLAARSRINGNGSNGNGDEILGINDDVIEQVGHPLGTFANAQLIQETAAYLRAKKAPSGFFSTKPGMDDDSTLFDSAQAAKYDKLIATAYAESGEVTGAYAKTFYMGTMLMGEAAREAIWAIYVWCRRTDEIVDAPRENPDDMLTDLSSWEMRLEELWEYGVVTDVFDLVLLDVRIQYPKLSIQPFMDMIRGMLMDVPDLGQEVYQTFDELHLYCYRVAGTVGVMSLPVFGCAEGYDDDVAREPALSLGVAFQLTNILRDVGEDAVERGRVYLPREDLERFNVSVEQIMEQRVDDNYRAMMKFQIERARMYYERARRGVFMLAPNSRLPVQASLDAYGEILDKIQANNYDTLTTRAYVDKWEKLSILPFSWYRTTDLSRMMPLPGDKPVDLTV